MRTPAILLVFAIFTAPALAADEPTDPGTIAWNNKIAMNSQGIDGVFVVRDDGAIRHVQSGMICPAKFANVQLWHLAAFPSKAGKGMDVSCDYGRNGPANRFVSKLTLFATIAPGGWTLDNVYDNYRGEVVQANPGVRDNGPLPQGQGATGLPGDWKSETYIEHRDGRDFTSELIVALRGKWMFEVRTTYDGLPDAASVDGSGEADVVADRQMAATAYRATVDTLPK